MAAQERTQEGAIPEQVSQSRYVTSGDCHPDKKPSPSSDPPTSTSIPAGLLEHRLNPSHQVSSKP